MPDHLLVRMLAVGLLAAAAVLTLAGAVGQVLAEAADDALAVVPDDSEPFADRAARMVSDVEDHLREEARRG